MAGQGNYLKNLRLLNIHDEDYHLMSYKLKVALSSATVKIVSIHAINSPAQDAAFRTRNVTTTQLDSWVDSRELPKENSIENIIHHGGKFRILDSAQGAIFPTGNITSVLSDGANMGRPAGPQRYEFLHCCVAVGQPFVVSRDQVGHHGLPTGYDSIKIWQDQGNGEAEEQQQQDIESGQYHHEYIINKPERVYPDYVVIFDFDEEADRMKAVPTCEECNQRPAGVYCMQDNVKLCPMCDTEIHSRSQTFSKHDRVPLSEMQKSVGMTMCPEHPGMPVQYFDIQLHVPVCVYCKMSGTHSTGENATHELIAIQDAYKYSMTDMEREMETVEERKRRIMTQLQSVERRTSAVVANHQKVEQDIRNHMMKALQLLAEETQGKLSALLSDEAELRRQVEFYAWLQKFLDYERTVLNPVEFLQAYKNHSKMLSEAPSEYVDGAAAVRPNIRLDGTLTIVVDDMPPARGGGGAHSMGAPMGGGQPQSILKNPNAGRPASGGPKFAMSGSQRGPGRY